jgi:glycosyltransferase involved in cell wall biosynthesis
MKIALIKGMHGLKMIGGGVNYTIIRIFQYLKKEHDVKLIYGNRILPSTLGLIPFGKLEGYDIIHAGAPEFAAFISSKSPIIATFYDDGMCNSSVFLKNVTNIFDKIKISINKWILRFLIKKSLKKYKKIVAISEEAKKSAIRSFKISPEKIICIPPGIDTRQFRPLNVKIKEKNKKTLRLFFCGGIGKRKGVENLLKAVKILNRELKDTRVELYLAGALHPLFPLKKILKEFNLGNQVTYLGHVSDDKLVELYNQADVFVFPSYFEGFGIPPLEALSCGTKVVCTELPSVKLFKKFVTITDTNPEAIAENILKARQKKVNFKLVRKMIEEKYSLEVTGKEYVKLYKELLKEKQK